MLKVEPFRTSHAERLMGHRTSPLYLPMARLGPLYESWGPAFTMFDGDIPMACGGLVLGWHGTATAWLMVKETPHGAMALALARRARTLLRDLAAAFSLHRIDTVVEAEMVIYRRFASWLGFEAEAMLLNYGPARQTFIQYVWFPQGAK